MLTSLEGEFGKIWADTCDPIVFLNLKPLHSNETLKKIFEALNTVMHSLERRKTSTIFLIVNLKEATGSQMDLLMLLIQFRVQFNSSPIHISIIQPINSGLTEALHSEAKKKKSQQIVIHHNFEDALRQIAYLIRQNSMVEPKGNWLNYSFRWLAQLGKA